MWITYDWYQSKRLKHVADRLGLPQTWQSSSVLFHITFLICCLGFPFVLAGLAISFWGFFWGQGMASYKISSWVAHVSLDFPMLPLDFTRWNSKHVPPYPICVVLRTKTRGLCASAPSPALLPDFISIGLERGCFFVWDSCVASPKLKKWRNGFHIS